MASYGSQAKGDWHTIYARVYPGESTLCIRFNYGKTRSEVVSCSVYTLPEGTVFAGEQPVHRILFYNKLNQAFDLLMNPDKFPYTNKLKKV